MYVHLPLQYYQHIYMYIHTNIYLGRVAYSSQTPWIQNLSLGDFFYIFMYVQIQLS
jgi:hypothetical protein